jgi:hypothetical protein
VRPFLDSLTQESNAGHSGAFLGEAWSTFDRLPAGVRDHHAGKLDLPPAHPHGLAVRRGEPAVDQVGQHFDAEPMGEQRCPSAATQLCGS